MNSPNNSNGFFKIAKSGDTYSVVHLPSGDTYQQHLCDFPNRKEALSLLDRLDATGADWSNAEGMAGMPSAIANKVWAAIYAK